MKKLHSLYAALLMTFLFSTNNSFGQTTEIEYNYITKGYQAQVVEQGGDMKKGYRMDDVNELSFSGGAHKAILKKMMRITETTEILAAYMLVYERTGNITSYYCIPRGNGPLLSLYYDALLDDPMDMFDGEAIGKQNRLYLISMLLSSNLK